MFETLFIKYFKCIYLSFLADIGLIYHRTLHGNGWNFINEDEVKEEEGGRVPLEKFGPKLILIFMIGLIFFGKLPHLTNKFSSFTNYFSSNLNGLNIIKQTSEEGNKILINPPPHSWKISLSCPGYNPSTLFRFFYWETGYFNTLDITLDRAGYYLCWGCLTWVQVNILQNCFSFLFFPLILRRFLIIFHAKELSFCHKFIFSNIFQPNVGDL